ncbi:MAG: PQQ-like beta-propeller repeat protein [Gemmataceae bacterium]|nr:PQQ-like beta-propeller repeat protein [Gemmataceae bacterium]
MSKNAALSFLLVAPLALVFAGDASAQTWSEFRGSTGDGHAKATGLPVSWSETENVTWKTAIHDKGWSSPVVWDDQIWVTTARENGKELFALCLDRKSGKIVKDVKLFDVEKPAFCHPFNSYASSTPAVEKGRLYAHFGSNGTACLDTASGKVLWERRDFKCDHFRGAGSSPIVHGDLLFLLFDGVDVQYVVALDKNSGKTVWKKDRAIEYPPSKDGDDRKGYATPAVLDIDGKPQLVCPAAGGTIAYEPATGKELWRVLHGGMNAACRPILAHNLIYVTCGYKPQLLAIRTGGSGDITKSHVQWKESRGVSTRPSILVIGDLIFMVSDGGIASCLEAKTGNQVWQERLGNEFSASPVYADGHIYFPDQAGTIHVVEPTRTFKKVSSNKLADGCMASPAVVGKSLLIRTKTHLYCIEKQ